MTKFMMDQDAKTMDFRLITRLSLLMGALLTPVGGATAAMLTLENQDPAAVYLIQDAKLIQEREGVKIAERSYRYFELKLAYYYSFARVANYYQTDDGRHPLYGLVYRCKQPASDAHREQEPDTTEAAPPPAEVGRFIALAKNRCANVLKPR